MNTKEILKDTLDIINLIPSFDYDILTFIHENKKYFSDVPVRSLLLNSYIRTGITDESSYIFLIGSYIYYRFTNTPVTWLQRRRFADFHFSDEWNIFFQKTLTYNNKKFTHLKDIEDYIVLQMIYQ